MEESLIYMFLVSYKRLWCHDGSSISPITRSPERECYAWNETNNGLCKRNGTKENVQKMIDAKIDVK